MRTLAGPTIVRRASTSVEEMEVIHTRTAARRRANSRMRVAPSRSCSIDVAYDNGQHDKECRDVEEADTQDQQQHRQYLR